MPSQRFSTADFVRALPAMSARGSGGVAHLHPGAPVPASLEPFGAAVWEQHASKMMMIEISDQEAPAGGSMTRERTGALDGAGLGGAHGGALQSILDEVAPLVRLYNQIIDTGLVSVDGPPKKASVIVIGAGCAGLVTARELKRAGLGVTVLEASHRVGGRVKTIREPFATGLHGEGGAMRLPSGHVLVRRYLKKFGLEQQLEPFQQANRIIYLAGLGEPLTYERFEQLLVAQDPRILGLFPGLAPRERGKTIDTLWSEAVAPVHATWTNAYQAVLASGGTLFDAISSAYLAVESKFGDYTLRGFFEGFANWSQDAILLYDLANAHVVMTNGFVESWKDGFLSSQEAGGRAGMQQLQDGMETIPLAFLRANDGIDLADDIRYGATVRMVERISSGRPGRRVRVTYDSASGTTCSVEADYVVFAVPFTTLNMLEIQPYFGPKKRTAIRTLRYVEVTKVLLQFKTRWWENYLTEIGQGKDGGVITDLPIRYLMFPSAGSAQFAGGQKRGVVMASYTFEQDATEIGSLTEAERIRIVARDLRTIFPKRLVKVDIDEELEIGASQVWPATDKSGGSAFAYFGPGQRMGLFEGTIEPDWDGLAHFAGEHASYSHGWIEGAIESALRVAYQIYDLQTPVAGSPTPDRGTRGTS